MPRVYDPLTLLPSEQTLQTKLAEAERLVRQLKILLRIKAEVAEAERSDGGQEAEEVSADAD